MNSEKLSVLSRCHKLSCVIVTFNGGNDKINKRTKRSAVYV